MIRRGGTAAAIFLIVLMLVGAGSASAAPTGTISGAVTDGSANPLVGACVTATAPGVGFGSANTGAGGSYTITGLASGTYTVSFSACLAGNYAPNTITGVQVTDGQTTTQNATLTAGATLTGTVTDSSANPLSGACVTAIGSVPGGSGGSASTGANGSYTIIDLTAGSYSLVFRACSAGDYQSITISGVQATAGQATTQNASLAPGGAVSGHVTDGTANLLAGACVTASPAAPGGQGGSASTDSSGAYTISGLAPGNYRLAFSACAAGNYAPATITGVQVSAGQTTTEDISLTAGAIISGQVTNTTANPLAGVCVTATSSTPGGPGGSATTDASGDYSVIALPPGTYTLSFRACSAGNYQDSSISGVQGTAGQTTTENVQLAPGATISGTVKDTTGNPLNGACVSANPSGAPGNGGSAQTDATGNYTITGLAGGSYTLAFTACSAGNYVPDTISGVQATVGQTTTENATLVPGATISGTVTDGSGNPLAGVCVSATASGPAGQTFSTNTDASGGYAIEELASGTYSVTFAPCSAGDYGPVTISGVPATSGQTTTEDATLPAGATITGTITDGSGNPLSGVCVSANPSAPGGQGGNATTDATGSYTITDLAAGTYGLMVNACSAGNYLSRAISGVQVTAGQTTTENVTLQLGATISGAVSDGSGNPLAGVCVTANPSGGGTQIAGTTDLTGAYSLAKVPPGSYTLTFAACSAGNYAPQTISGVQATAGQTTAENTTLASGATISGKVTDTTGSPLHGACVTASSSGAQGPPISTDANGNYTITDLAAGTYTLAFTACSAGNYVPGTIPGVQATAGQTTTENASLAPGATITGTVADGSGNPLSGVCVSANPSAPGGQGGNATTNATGDYTLTHLAAGTYTLSFSACSAGNYAPATITGVQATASQTTTENVTLAPGATISGKVTDASGNPLAGACVSVNAGGQSNSTTTDASGNYTITKLTAGSYTVVFGGCAAGNYVRATVTGVQATAGQTTTQNVALAPAGTISGNVTDTSGNPLPGACVAASPAAPGGQGAGAQVAGDGSYSITGLGPGTYTLTFAGCSAGDFQSHTVTGVQVTVGQTSTENAVLAPGGAISGTVTDGSGNPLSGACVTASPPGQGAQGGGATTDANGSYAITGLAPGTYTVEFTGCSAGNYAFDVATGVQVTAGQTTTENASLAPGATISGRVTNGSGTPLAGACVSANSAGPDSQSFEADTDSNGMYAITGLAAGAYTVEVDGCSAGNFAPDTITGVQVTVGQTTTENATLVPPGAVTGKVTDSSGNPLVGACVTVKDSAGRTGTIHTDASGAYSLTGVPPGTYTFTFSGCSAGNYLSRTVTVQVNPGQTLTENATLVRPGTITGKILNTLKNSVVGACVTASPSGSATTTNSSGVYTITGLLPGTYTLTIKGCTAGTYFTQTISGVQVTDGATTTENVTLVGPGTITGKILNTDGNPVAGACVTGSPSGTATTNSSGVYTITALTAGTYTLTITGCSAGTYFPKTITGVQVAASKTTTTNITLVQPGTITGKILNTYKNSVVGACVTASPSGSAATNSSGVYTITGLTAGTYTLTIKGCSAGTYFTQTIASVQVAAGKTTTENITLVQPGTITGKITDAAGNPVTHACLTGSPSGTATTNSSGVYTITGLTAGTYTLTIAGCTPGTYFPKTITGVQVGAGKTKTQNATLIQPGTITGKILNTAKNAVIGACVTGSPSGSATTNSSGVYTITGLLPGTYTLTIKGCSAGTYFTQTIASIQVIGGKTTTENVTLVQAATITGTITNSAGKALAGACVAASPSGGNTTTNSSGVYTLGGLAAGTYTLTIKGCTAGTYLNKTITGVQVAAGKTKTQNATLIQPGTITGKILNTAKNAVVGACVTGSPSGSATTNSSGVYTITGLLPGTYTLTIKGCSAGTYFTQTIMNITVTGGATTTENVTLVQAATITGTITNSAGKALAGACVAASPSGGNTTTNSSGVYTLGGLAAGTYTLTIKGCTAGTYLNKTITGVQVAAGKTKTQNASLASG